MKNCLLLVLMLISFSAWAHASQNPYVVDHDRFYDMPREQKEMIIKKRMEMMIEMEAKQPIQTYASTLDSERVKKLVEAMKFLNSLMLNDAYAAVSNKDFVTLSGAFSEALRKVPNSCIYGGYVSTMVGGYCLHPSKVAGHPQIPKESQRLIANNYDNPGNKCKAPSEISCNPMVFGYEKASKGTPLCVPTGFVNPKQNAAHNVSHACMKKALGPSKDELTVDKPDDRKQFLMSQMEANRDAFDAVQKPLFRMCACNEKQSSQHQRYFNYMRPHRTCYGMLKSLRNASYSECAVLKVDNVNNDYKGFVEKFNKFFEDDRDLEIPIKALRAGFDDDYQKIIDDPLMKNFCAKPDVIVPPKEETVKTLVCEPTCAEKVSQNGKGEKSTSFVCETAKVYYKIKDAKGEREDPVAAKDVTGLPFTYDPTKDPSFEVKVGTDSASCKFQAPQKPEEKAPACTVSVAESKEKGIFTVTVDSPAPAKDEKYEAGKEPKLSEIKWAGAEGMKENEDKNPNVRLVTQTDKKQTITVTAKFKEKETTCSGEVPAKGEEIKNYKIVLKANDSKNTDPKAKPYHLVATILLNDKEVEKIPAGFKISYQNSNREAEKKAKEEDNNKGKAADGDGSQPKTDVKTDGQGTKTDGQGTKTDGQGTKTDGQGTKTDGKVEEKDKKVEPVSDKADPGDKKEFVTTSLSVTEQKQVGKTSSTTAVLLDEKDGKAATSAAVEIPALAEESKEEPPKTDEPKQQWQPTPGMGGGPGRQMQAPIKRNHGLQMIR